MILRLCILVLMALAFALPAKAAMQGAVSDCPSQRAITCEIPHEIAATPAQSQTRNQAEPPCLWKGLLAEIEVAPPPFRKLTLTFRPMDDKPLQGLVPAGLERPPRLMVV